MFYHFTTLQANNSKLITSTASRIIKYVTNFAGELPYFISFDKLPSPADFNTWAPQIFFGLFHVLLLYMVIRICQQCTSLFLRKQCKSEQKLYNSNFFMYPLKVDLQGFYCICKSFRNTIITKSLKFELEDRRNQSHAMKSTKKYCKNSSNIEKQLLTET